MENEHTTDPALAAPDLPRWAGTLAGVLGAGVALGVGELISGFSEKVPSLVIAMGEVFVDTTPGAVVESGISAAGTNDKPILLATIVVASLAIGGLLGRVALVSRRRSDLGFVAFGLLGAWAAQRNPFASTAWAVVAALVAAAVGALTVRVLLGIGSLPAVTVRADPDVRATDAPRFPARRAFLGTGAAAGAAALVGWATGRTLRADRSVEDLRGSVELPDAVLTPNPASSGTPAGALDGAVTGISPYITPAKDFYRIDTALTVPQVNAEKWKLKIGGLVDRPYELTYEEILAMDLEEHTVTLSCVSNAVGDEYVGNAVWRGVPLTKILDRAGVQKGGTQIAGISVDDFDASFPTELAYDGRTALLAVGMNGEPLPVVHGFPARLVVAGLYGYVSAVKWIEEIRLVGDDYKAYWIPRGWSKLGPIKTQSRIDVPRGSKDLRAGPTTIGGVAWAPGKGIAKVEVQIDGGAWQTCTIGTSVTDETWVQWMLPWDARKGEHELRVRATDKTGFTQTSDRKSPAPNGAEGWHTVYVTVV